MRGIDRFLAAILLAGAIGGTAMFARHLGTVPEPEAVRLTAPPPGHLTAPGAVRARLLVPFGTATTPMGPTPTAPTPTAPPATAATAPAVRTEAAPKQAPVSPAALTPGLPPPAPKPPAPQPPATRILAAVPLTPTEGTSTDTSNGDCTREPGSNEHGSKGRQKGHGRDSAPGQQKKPAPAPVAPAAVALTPTAPADIEAGDGADDSHPGHAGGYGNGRGHSKHD
jgi:hypothetical protein